MKITFSVFGQPATQGSKQAQLIRRKGGEIVLDRNGRPLTRVREDNPRTAEWRQQVAAAARAAYDGPLLTEAVSLTCVFVRPRPKSHFGTGRNAAHVKPGSPAHPTTKPDTLKLARAVEDSLTGVVWQDDSQVCRHRLVKEWGRIFEVRVEVEVLEAKPRAYAGDLF